VEGRVAWLPKLEDLYGADDAMTTASGDFGSTVAVSAARDSLQAAKRLLRNAPTKRRALVSRAPSFMTARKPDRRATWSKLKTLTTASAGFNRVRASSAMLVAEAQKALAHQGAPPPAEEVSEGDVGVAPAARTAIRRPWEDAEKLALRGMRRDALQSRLLELDERLNRRKAGELPQANSETALGACSPPRHSVSLSQRPATVATADAQAELQAEARKQLLSDPKHRPMTAAFPMVIEVPSDGALEAMDPLAALGRLRQIEEGVLKEMGGHQQSIKDHIKERYALRRRIGRAGGCSRRRGNVRRSGKGGAKRVVLFHGVEAASVSPAAVKARKDYLMGVLEAISPKRQQVTRRVVHDLDGMSQRINKELTQLMLRKRRVDAQEIAARQALRRQELDDLATGAGYIAIRFSNMCRRPFTRA
jgi:hypothetical protein